MAFARRARWFVLLAGLLAASVGSAVFGDFLPHNDDGCRVETHCLVCQRVQGSTSALPSLVHVAVALEVVGAASAPAPRLKPRACARTAESRGPPPTLPLASTV